MLAITENENFFDSHCIIIEDSLADWMVPLAKKMFEHGGLILPMDTDNYYNPHLVTPEWLALFVEVCKQWPDPGYPERSDFTRGKWASIQRLQGILEKAITEGFERGKNENTSL